MIRTFTYLNRGGVGLVRIALLAAALAALGLMYAKPGSAATTCTDSNGVLTVTNTTSSDLAIATKPDVWDGLDVLVKADGSMVCGAFVAA